MSNAANTVDGYLASLPAERREVVSAVRDLVRRHLPQGYRESMEWGMIGYGIPLERYPDTYNGQPLCYAALAAQKNHYALYLMSAYQEGAGSDWLRNAFARAGKNLDMGKSCLRFKSLDDLPLPVLGEFIASVTPEQFIARYEASRAAPHRSTTSGGAREKATSKTKAGAKKSTAKKTPARKRA